jgi:single-strand DNA-binding protein
MANGVNITVIGNITREPEMRYTPTGQATARFGIAANRRWRDNTGEWQEQTSFFDVICWRELAENCTESLHKGARVIVEGRIEQRTYETKEGDKRSVFEITADEVGPSLRWATAEVKKNDRRTGGDGGGGGSRPSTSPRDDAPDYADYGEEPF